MASSMNFLVFLALSSRLLEVRIASSSMLLYLLSGAHHLSLLGALASLVGVGGRRSFGSRLTFSSYLYGMYSSSRWLFQPADEPLDYPSCPSLLRLFINLAWGLGFGVWGLGFGVW